MRMDLVQNNYECFEIPEGFIVFISGVPGVGKTTISYELLKRCNSFRIIEETDLIREVLRGYNFFLGKSFPTQSSDILRQVRITDHTKLLSLDEAKQQCEIMRSSFEYIVARQQRKGIPSIINGVHIVPETLNGIVDNHNVIFINLYIHSEDALYKRLINRNPNSYMVNHVPFIFKTNQELYISTMRISKELPYIFHNVGVTESGIDETLCKIMGLIRKAVEYTKTDF